MVTCSVLNSKVRKGLSYAVILTNEGRKVYIARYGTRNEMINFLIDFFGLRYVNFIGKVDIIHKKAA